MSMLLSSPMLVALFVIGCVLYPAYFVLISCLALWMQSRHGSNGSHLERAVLVRVASNRDRDRVGR